MLEARAYGVALLLVTETRTGVRRTVPVAVSADQYFWSASFDEIQVALAENPTVWEYDRVGFDVLESGDQYASAIPLWRFFETATYTHFWTTDPDGEEFLPPFSSLPGVREGISSYVLAEPIPGTVPVYRWSSQLGVHFWSTDPSGESFDPTATLEGIAFYAFPSGSGIEGAVPMHRIRCYVCE